MLASEKRSLFRFMVIYALSLLVLFAVVATLFYRFEMTHDKMMQKKALKKESERIAIMLKQSGSKAIDDLHNIDVAIYGRGKSYLIGTFWPQDVEWKDGVRFEDGFIYHNGFIPPPHRDQFIFMVTRRVLDVTARDDILYTIFYAFVFFLLFITVVGYFLGRLFIAPMREALESMNRFIQDTTHELNTPVATILSNIEMLEILGTHASSPELKRIEIASKTLSRIYDSLSYMKLHGNSNRAIEELDISHILRDRITYFSSLADAKKIKIETDIQEKIIRQADRTDISRLIDNLLSNAIKYNNIGGSIKIILTQSKLSIQDSGRGMDTKTLSKVFERFARGDESEGGFGIGLDIVSQICDSYGYKIEISSKLGAGTTASVKIG